MVAAFNKNGYLYAFNRTNLAAGPLWQQAIARAGGSPQHGDASVSSAAIGGGRLFMAGETTTIGGTGYAGSVRAFDPTTGNVLWQRGESGPVFAALAYANGLVIDGAGSTLEVLDATSGSPLYSYTTGSTIYGAPSVSNGRIFAGSTDGSLYAFGLAEPAPNGDGDSDATPTPTGPTATPTATNTPGSGLTPAYVQGTSADPQTAPSSVAVSYARHRRRATSTWWRWAGTTPRPDQPVTDSAGNSYQVAVPWVGPMG